MNHTEKLEKLNALHELESQLRNAMLDCVTAERDALRRKLADADKRATFWHKTWEIEARRREIDITDRQFRSECEATLSRSTIDKLREANGHLMSQIDELNEENERLRTAVAEKA